MQIGDYQSALEKLNGEMCFKIEEANRIIRELYEKIDEQSGWAQRSVRQVEERDRIIQRLQAELDAARAGSRK